MTTYNPPQRVEVDRGASEVNVPDHTCNRTDSGFTPPARVEINDTRIPVINKGVRTEMRKDEAMALTKHSEVYFPSEWNDTDYESAVRALDPNENNVYDPVDIYIRDKVSNRLVLAHRGFVMGVGSGAVGNIERRFTVGDVGQILTALPFDGKYEQGASVKDIVDDVIDRLEEAIVPFVFDSIEQRSALRIEENDSGNATIRRGVELDENIIEVVEEIRDEVDFGDSGPTIYSDITPEIVDAITDDVIIGVGPYAFRFDVSDDLAPALETWVDIKTGVLPWLLTNSLGFIDRYVLSSGKSFHDDEHTAADALRWAEEQSDGIFYFQAADENGVALVYDEVMSNKSLTATHVDDGGDMELYRNNALHEIRPTNALVATSKRSPSGKYFQTVVVHEPLINRASEPLTPPVQKFDVRDPAALIRKAQQELKRELHNSALGMMKSAPCPLAAPYSTVTALPTCGTNVESTSPFLYEVESVVHYVSATRPDNNRQRKHETELNVSVPARLNNITTASIEVKQTTTESESFLDKIQDIFDFSRPEI